MSYRIRKKSRPQGDVEIYGGPLKQKRFDGGMNIDVPASEIKDNEVAYASNVICREYGIEPRSGSVEISEFAFSEISSASHYAYESVGLKFGNGSPDIRHVVSYNNTLRYYGNNPGMGAYLNAFGYNWNTNAEASAWDPGSGDTTVIPYRRGFLVFNASKITYSEYSGCFQVNAANPIHGIKDDNASGAFKYRYLITLSRSSIYGSDGLISTYTATDRYAAGAELVHESGTNGNRYQNSGTSTVRQNDYGEVFTAAAIASGAGYTLTQADLKAVFSSTGTTTDNSAAHHFTHATVWRTCDFGTAGAALGNNKAIYYWVADVKRSDIFGVYAGFSDVYSDDTIKNNGLILKTQGFDPMPSGSCGESAGGWMFVSDRTNATSENYLYYCADSNSPENIGYHFYDIQKWRFKQGIRAIRASQDILSIFCESSSHICNMTSYVTDASKLQSIPFLNYFYQVDPAIGIKDWATLDGIDKNTFIAVCSDNSVRKWDTTKWGDDLAYNKVSSEIQQIVPASPFTYERGSIGRYYKGAYYLWYSKSISDTATTSCLRYGMGIPDTQYAKGTGKQAGFGWTFYTNTPFPSFKRGVSVVNDAQGVQRLVVIRASTGKFYWIDTFKPFVGAIDNANTGVTGAYQMVRQELDLNNYPNGTGTEITSTIKFRELIGSQESDVLIHEETFHRWRPLLESDSYRSGFTVSMSAYKDGSTTAYETVTNQPRMEAIKFTKEIAANRVQLAVTTSVGAWRYVGIESYFRSIDKVRFSTAGDNSSSESSTSYPQYQAELATNLTHWITRRETSIDRATGANLTASGSITLVTGPDSKTESAQVYSSQTYSEVVTNSYTDFSVSFFVKDPDLNLNFFSIAGTNPMSCKFTGNTTLSFSGLGTVTVATVASGWQHFFIKRSGTTISVYQNGVLKGTITSGTTLGGGNLTLGNASGGFKIFDFRVYSDVKTVDGMTYYYNNVTIEQGDMVCPQV